MASMDGALYECRICLDTGPRRDLIAPCSCRGSSKWVHRACIDQWRTMGAGGTDEARQKSFSKCPTCLQNYVLISMTTDTPEEQRQRKMRYYHRVAVDVLSAIAIFQAVVLVCGWFIWVCDKGYKLMHIFSYFKSTMAFYYVAGFTLVLSLIGIVFLLVLVCGGSSAGPTMTYWDWYFCNAAMGDSQCCCCCCGNTTTEAAGAAGRIGGSGAGMGCSNCPACCEAGSCGSCSCDACAGGAAGGDALPAVIVCLLIFAALGLLVSVFAGVVMINNVLTKHMNIIERLGYTQDYIVADLEPMDVDAEQESRNPIMMVSNYGTDNCLVNNKSNNNKDVENNNDADNIDNKSSKGEKTKGTGAIELLLLGAVGKPHAYDRLSGNDDTSVDWIDRDPLFRDTSSSSSFSYSLDQEAVEEGDFLPSAPPLPDSAHLSRCNNPSAPILSAEQERRLRILGYI